MRLAELFPVVLTSRDHDLRRWDQLGETAELMETVRSPGGSNPALARMAWILGKYERALRARFVLAASYSEFLRKVAERAGFL